MNTVLNKTAIALGVTVMLTLQGCGGTDTLPNTSGVGISTIPGSSSSGTSSSGTSKQVLKNFPT